MRKKSLWLLLALLPISAVADGIVLPQIAFAQTRIPDQRALICWSNGVERLVIETRFSGSGTNFAWVIPLPSQPEIEAATTGIFPTLAHQLRPEVIHEPPALFAILLFCLAIGYLLLFVRQGRKRSVWELVACLVAGISLLWLSVLAAILLSPLLLWITERIRQGREKPCAIIIVVILAFLLGGMFLSSLGTAGVKFASSSELTELASQRVGAFDTTAVMAKTPRALLDWLVENEFVVPTNAEPVIADYINRGWIFVAAKLHRDSSTTDTNSIHPLSFTFRTEQPVYPLRLTGIGNRALDVELYVFGNKRAEAKNFEVVRCASVVFPNESPWPRNDTTETPVPVVHPKLRQWTLGCAVVTKLAGTLTPEQMLEDATIAWSSYQPHWQTIYSRRGALITAANWAVGLVFCAAVLSVVLLALKHEWRSATGRIVITVFMLGLLVFAITYQALPKVQVRAGRFPRYFLRYLLGSLGQNVVSKWETTPPKSLAEARQTVEEMALPRTENFLLGGKIREEDSPGNYLLRSTESGFEFVWFDADGGEHVARTPR